MGYKLKPNKAVLSRFKITKTGKVKRHQAMTSHLMSARTSKKKRQLGRAAILHEGIARNMRILVGASHKHPAKVAHERALKAKAKEQAAKQPVS
jgi:large subunit ribosomal protein L35